ncbi:hypothetical protein OSB04_004675 [Centaurea solstitialis]|uniref:Fatty acid desaturase domain-containing protein n=1 Tax=Centaurea solstitialis TaxID=347529 RepID=A0AA38TEJ5_9ASTR|nr:hypothetical protein OSB04_004675 [Centaurea solstitialis]
MHSLNQLPKMSYSETLLLSDVRKESGHNKIFMSDVVVTRKKNLFHGRKWNIVDVITVLWILAAHLLTLFAPFTFSWGAFWAGFWCYALCGMLGLTLSYHRNLAHRSFKLPKWLEYTFAYFGVQAAQRDPIFWVSIHRSHHQYVESDKDPHSPTFGFWFSHMGWLFDSGYIVEKYKERKNVEDLKSQAFYRFIKKTYLWHVLGFAAIVYALGGFPYLVWVMVKPFFLFKDSSRLCPDYILGNSEIKLRSSENKSGHSMLAHGLKPRIDEIFHHIPYAFCQYVTTVVVVRYDSFFDNLQGVRLTWSYHWTFLVNSACHIWGYQSWNTDDLSKNNWWVAIVTFGEGWHNNHHAFEYSARFGLEWWQLDLCWWFIRVLEALGLATNVKLPTEAHKLRKSVVSGNKLK